MAKSYYWRRDDDQSLEDSCPTCAVAPGQWCIYVGNTMRAGTPTQRLHPARTQQLWTKRPETAPKRRRPEPIARALEMFDRAEDRRLRTWLQQHAALFLVAGDAGSTDLDEAPTVH